MQIVIMYVCMHGGGQSLHLLVAVSGGSKTVDIYMFPAPYVTCHLTICIYILCRGEQNRGNPQGQKNSISASANQSVINPSQCF